MEHLAELRFVTYLSPSIPRAFFEALVEHIRRSLGKPTTLLAESRFSGPMRGGEDPFSKGEADVGFICAPSLFWLREESAPAELLAAAPVFRDSRTPGKPAYFSEVVVHRESTVRSFADLRGCSWAYNDPCSLSGYFCLLKKLADMGENRRFFDHIRCSGSHLTSMKLIAGREVEAAAVDSNVLRITLQSSPKLAEQIQILESWGPFPIQPVVIRSDLSPKLKIRIRAALLAICPEAGVSPALAAFGLERFAPVTYEHYAPEEQALRKCERALGTRLR